MVATYVSSFLVASMLAPSRIDDNDDNGNNSSGGGGGGGGGGLRYVVAMSGAMAGEGWELDTLGESGDILHDVVPAVRHCDRRGRCDDDGRRKALGGSERGGPHVAGFIVVVVVVVIIVVVGGGGGGGGGGDGGGGDEQIWCNLCIRLPPLQDDAPIALHVPHKDSGTLVEGRLWTVRATVDPAIILHNGRHGPGTTLGSKRSAPDNGRWWR
jgi:hypothetical protein